LLASLALVRYLVRWSAEPDEKRPHQGTMSTMHRTGAIIDAPLNRARSKELGAYYTSAPIAEFLVTWAVRSGSDRVIDPSFGGGVFLQAAASRVRDLVGEPALRVFGVELDSHTHRTTADFASRYGVVPSNLQQGDFFQLADGLFAAFDAVVGNPPFIRYQQFSGSARQRAVDLMRKHGVRMSELASSWAPFLVGAAGLLRPGGRLAMVVPMELCHATYGRNVLAFLTRSFRTINLLSFQRRLFPELNQDTLLLLADECGNSRGELRWRHLHDAASLTALLPTSPRIPRARRLDSGAVAAGHERLVGQFLPARARGLYAELCNNPKVARLGDLADAGIGYVTGANNFFHVSAETIKDWGIPSAFLRRAVCRSRAFTGLRFTSADWDLAFETGDAAQLLALPRRGVLPPSVRRYLEYGESQRVHLAYKCRTRQPWYHVPHVHQADAFLTYMSGFTPRLVANDAAAIAPNTLHIVRIHPLCVLTAQQLVVSWQSSLTQLSAEVEGHAMGGGLLKLEPSEAERVVLALPGTDLPRNPLEALDTLSRHGRTGIAQATVDRMVLQNHVGLSRLECRTLQEATEALRTRRLPQRN
jgi:adenine-specific DNA-methyltransferase